MTGVAVEPLLTHDDMISKTRDSAFLTQSHCYIHVLKIGSQGMDCAHSQLNRRGGAIILIQDAHEQRPSRPSMPLLSNRAIHAEDKFNVQSGASQAAGIVSRGGNYYAAVQRRV